MKKRIMETYRYIPVEFTRNGDKIKIEVEAGETSLHVIRDQLSLKGTKEGCGIGECGACTIVVDGKSVNACLMPAAQLQGREVITIEGLAHGEDLHPLQQAFMDRHAVQCGFCTPGILMSGFALLNENPDPSHDEIVEEISGNLCRCTGYQQIVTSIEDAAKRLSVEKEK